MDVLIGLILIGIVLFLYFLPTYIAVKRDHDSQWAILLLNLLLGWTLFVWIVVFIWSLSAGKKVIVIDNVERDV